MIYFPNRGALPILRTLFGTSVLTVAGLAFFSYLLHMGTTELLLICLFLLIPRIRPLFELLTTRYAMTDDALLVRMGPHHWTIPFEYIESVRWTNRVQRFFANGEPGLAVNYRCRPRVTETLKIAPENGDSFLQELQTRCAGLIPEGRDLVRKDPLAVPTYVAPSSDPGSGTLAADESEHECFPARCDPLFISETINVPLFAAALIFLAHFDGLRSVIPGGPKPISILIGLGAVAYAALQLWRLYSARYELNSKCLIIHFGEHRLEIPIGQIDEVFPEVVQRTWIHSGLRYPDFCWSWDRLRINCWDKACRELLSAYIAPRDRDQFLEALQGRATHLARRGDVLFRMTGEG